MIAYSINPYTSINPHGEYKRFFVAQEMVRLANAVVHLAAFPRHLASPNIIYSIDYAIKHTTDRVTRK